MYVNAKKIIKQYHIFPTGNVKRVSYQNGQLNGVQKFSPTMKKLVRYTEYKNNKKVNEEMIYGKMDL